MDKKLLFVANPLSGKGHIKAKFMEVVDIFVKDGWSVRVHTTQGTGDALEYTSSNGGDCDLLVVAGGDGTLNEVIQAMMLMSPDERPQLGYIPAGTTNDFASNMKMARDALKAAQDIVAGKTFKCDIGRFNQKSFIYVAAFGAFTDVAYDTPQQSKNMLGHMAYILEGVKRLSTLKSYPVKVYYEDGVIEDEYIFGMVSNTNHLAGIKAEKAFKAQLNDGLFEVILVKGPKNVIEFQDMLSAILKQELTSDAFKILRTGKVRFEFQTLVPWTLDGEYGGSETDVDVEIEKEAVTLVLGKEPEQ